MNSVNIEVRKVNLIMAIIGTQFEPREYYSKNQLDCLPTCIRAMLDNFGLGHYYYKILKGLSVTKYGYDFIEVATKLAENNLLAEVGLYDTDYIPKLKESESLSYQHLINLIKQNRDIPNHAKESLAEVARFSKKYPDLIKIKKTDFCIIENLLRKSLPICINILLSVIKKNNNPEDDVMHSFIIYAFDQKIKEIYIWDPASQYRIVEWYSTIKAWLAAGGYYLVIKKNKENNHLGYSP